MLVNCVMKKGRDKRWGADDNESMLHLFGEGLKLLEVDSELEVAGKFKTPPTPKAMAYLCLGWSKCL
jgi:hypothetical protein